MGIQGLLPFLKKIHSPVNVSQYSGCTVAVDAYCWLHRGAFSCADKLAMGEKTEQYVYYCMKYVNYLLSKDIKPILVFDGQHLPSKHDVEKSRRERREINRKKAAQFLREGKRAEARDCFQKCVDITPEMALELMKACRSRGVDCIVAPYEADAQLAYLNKAGIAQLIITEDSDLLLFGCDKIIFKMDFYGNGILIDSSRLNEVVEMRENYTFEKFRYMCILSGCDYLSSLPGIGLAKACKVFKTARQPDLRLVLKKIPSYLNTKIAVSDEYIKGFIQANNTFLYQLAFDPRERKLVPLTPYPTGMDQKELQYAGSYFSSEKALQIALGNWNIYSNEIMSDFDPDLPQSSQRSSQQKGRNKQNFLSHLSIWNKNYRPAGNIHALKEIQPKERCTTVGKEQVIDSKVLQCLKRAREDDEKEEKMVEDALTDTYGEACGMKKRKRSEGHDSKNSDSESDKNGGEGKDENKADKRHLWDVIQQEDKENSSETPVTVVTPRRNKFAVSPQSLKKERFDINAVVDRPVVKTEVKSRFFKTQSKLALKRTPASASRQEGISEKGDNAAVKNEPLEEDHREVSEEAEGVAGTDSCENSSASQQSLDDLEQKPKEPTKSMKPSSFSQEKNSPSAFSWSKFKFSKQAGGKGLSCHTDRQTMKNNLKVSQPFKQLKVARKECADRDCEPNARSKSPDSEENIELGSYSYDDESGYRSSSLDNGDSSTSQNTCLSQPSLPVTEGKFSLSTADTIDLTDPEDDITDTAQHQRFASKGDFPISCSTVSKEVADSITVTPPCVKTPYRASSMCRVSGLSREKGKNSSLTKHNSLPAEKQTSIKSMFAKFAHKSK
ncbi:exonuclease 1-like [Liolophura sinensis]|uniref:exonuclease 1-like n=1 Tax=Liolophura sinensis TaxID=3198878 RepID=UPI0031592388